VVRERRRHIGTVRSAARARNRGGAPARDRGATASTPLAHDQSATDATTVFARTRGASAPATRSIGLVILAVLALLAVLAARAAAAAPPASLPGDDASDVDPTDVDVFDSAGEPHAPAPNDAPAGGTVRGAPPFDARALPATREVLEVAIRAAGLAGDPASGWRARSRLAGLVPQLSARVGQDDTWRDVADPTLGHVITYGISASWRLERLVYDPSELRIATVDVLRRRERRRLAWYVISLYRAWRRTQNEDLAAQLDVVTDGWFSRRVQGQP
ncbi:MAG TPA: hypothetical protein VLT45_19345, partial [Kofleriaceae bacterium]|nr:hypothetical protein [Kofleriaceae bacterium]